VIAGLEYHGDPALAALLETIPVLVDRYQESGPVVVVNTGEVEAFGSWGAD
jgi:hypothetical protein